MQTTDSAPSRADPTVARASRLIGGAWGRHAVGGGWWTPLRVLLAIACFTLLLGYLQKAPCADGNWTGNKQYTHACYSDVIPLWHAEGLDRGAVPYRDTAVEYPVLTGGFMWLTAELTRAGHGVVGSLSEAQLFAVLTCLLLAACGLLAVAGTVGAAGRRPWDAAIFAASPLLVFHAFSNWDLLAMACASLALWAWSRERPVAAGVLIGLGTAAKLYPVLLLLPVAILAVRTRRYREAVWCVVAAALTWAAVNLPVAGAYFHGWWEFYSFSTDRSTEASTFWYIGHYLATIGAFGSGYAPAWVPPGAGVAVAVLAALGIVVWVGLRAPVKPRIGQLAFLAVLAFLLSTKVWSPQYSLWLVPLVALARPRWRISLLWQFSEIAVWFATMLWLLGFNDSAHGIDYGWLMLVLLIRDGFLLAIAGLVVYEMWHPERDVVRSTGLDDPGGGPFDRAPDRWRIRPRARPDGSDAGLPPVEVVDQGWQDAPTGWPPRPSAES